MPEELEKTIASFANYSGVIAFISFMIIVYIKSGVSVLSLIGLLRHNRERGKDNFRIRRMYRDSVFVLGQRSDKAIILLMAMWFVMMTGSSLINRGTSIQDMLGLFFVVLGAIGTWSVLMGVVEYNPRRGQKIAKQLQPPHLYDSDDVA